MNETETVTLHITGSQIEVGDVILFDAGDEEPDRLLVRGKITVGDEVKTRLWGSDPITWGIDEEVTVERER